MAQLESFLERHRGMRKFAFLPLKRSMTEGFKRCGDKIEEKVEWLLDAYPAARNKDEILLALFVLHETILELNETEQNMVFNLFVNLRTRHIVTMRQHFQNTLGLFPATEEVRRKREVYEEYLKRLIGTMNLEAGDEEE